MLSEQARSAVAELGGIARNLPNPHLLIGPFSRKEAVLSSRIEGTQASLKDLAVYEGGRGTDDLSGDVKEVANYVTALEQGLARLDKLPLSLRLIRELHENLMRGVRGDSARPGEFRRVQNHIGPDNSPIEQAVYVPPAPEFLDECLKHFEQYLNAGSELPPLINAAILHYQFEAIHPFIDGNGRVGRLLIILYLHATGILTQPLLYLSAFFESHRRRYYDLLLSVSQTGAWEEWIRFFLEGVKEQAYDATYRARRLLELRDRYRERLTQIRSTSMLVKLVDQILHSPAISVPRAADLLGITHRSATLNIEKLQRVGLLVEVTGKERNRIYLAPEVIRVVEEPLSKKQTGAA